MRDLLITGFGPFPARPAHPEIVENPSWPLALALAQGFACEAEVLPVHWERVADWVRTRPARYRRVLHLGVATSRREPTYELFAHNAVGGATEGIEGSTWPSETAVGGGPATLGATFLTPAELERLSLATSYTPGDYLCDFLFYRSLSRARRSRVGFVHVVPFAAMPMEEQLARLVRLVEATEEGASSGSDLAAVANSIASSSDSGHISKSPRSANRE